MATFLDPDGGFVETAGVLLATPGVGGQAEVVLPTPDDSRADAHVSGLMAAALTAAEFGVQLDVELSDLSVGSTGGAGGGRGEGEPEPVVVAQMPHPGEGLAQVVLLVDEDGVLSWHPPASGQATGGPTRGDDLLTYRIPLRTPVDFGEVRGPLGWLGKKVLKVLVFRLLDEALDRAGRYLAGRWERKHRWYGMRTLAAASALDGEPVDWARLVEGPALLLVHGTFSRATTAFSALPAADLGALVDSYDGRVALLDHPTVSVDPIANARWFVEQFAASTPDGTRLVLDVLAHSRGGLVARALAEQQGELALGGRRLVVRSAVFVGVPNAGTVLADPEHIGELLDTFTNLFDLVPDVGVIDALQMVLEVVKQVATGLVEGLDGLMAMNPGGDYLAALNKDGAGRDEYAAIAADFTPAGRSPRQVALNLIADRLFRTANDLVVPRDGVWEVDGRPLVPAGRRFSIGGDDAITHNGYFASPAVHRQLATWLAPHPGDVTLLE